MQTAAEYTGPSEVAILARILGNGEDDLPPAVARYLLALGFSDRDRARMHNLVVRNREGSLSSEETAEMFAYSKAGSLLGILKSKARRALKVKPARRTAP